MDGLECSEKKLSEIKVDNPTMRYDSEYFKKHYTLVFQTIKKQCVKKMSEVTSWITQGPNPSFSSDGVIPCLTGRNIANGRVNYNNPDYIDEYEYKKLKRYQLMPGDTLITLKGKGSIGKIGYVTENRKAIFSRNIGIVRPKGIDPSYLNIFILSRYGQELVLRGETGGTGQSTLTTSHIKLMDIPIFENVEPEIKTLLNHSEMVRIKAENVYAQAEQLLLSELGMWKFTPSLEAVSVKSLSESFLSSGRLDAEYYQPKYDQIISRIKKYNGGYIKLADAIEYVFTGEYSEEYQEKKESLKFFIRSTNMINGQIIPDDNYYVDGKKFSKHVTTGDIITARVGSVGVFAEVENGLNDAICSDNIICFRLPKTYYSDVYTLLFNSKPMFELIDRLARGSVQRRLNQGTLKNLLLPVLNKEIQEVISDKLQQSYMLKRKSEQLLEFAKSAVEIAIEQSEKAALEFLRIKGVE